MGEDLDKCYKIALDGAKSMGELIKERIWQTKVKVEAKSSEIDLVTETDQEVERYLISKIQQNFPHHLFIGEESSAGGIKCNLTDSPTWIIDPIDGTTNFVHGYPNVCISIALLVKKIPEIAIIYNPVINYLFEAKKGSGAKLNGKEIHVSGETDLSKSLLAFEFGTSREEDRQKNVLTNVNNLIRRVQGMRSSGSAAMNMALVALGSCDAYFEFGIHVWDVAAGNLLVREAGGVVVDTSGGEFDMMSRRVLCASNEVLAHKLASELHQLSLDRD